MWASSTRWFGVSFNWLCSIIALFEGLGNPVLWISVFLRIVGNAFMIIVKLKNIIGGKLMKIKYAHTSSITGAVEILLMVGNLGVESPNMALNRADTPATKGL